MNYLMQYVLEAQVRYPNISKSPFDVISHLLYVIGNGVDFTNGNPVINGSFYREIPFKDYYQQHLTLEQMLEIDERSSDIAIEEIYNRKKELNNCWIDIPERYLTDEQLWENAHKEFENRHNKVDWVINYSDDDLTNVSIVKSMLEKSMELNGYYDHIQLSRGYYKQDKFNENTDPYLLKVGLAFSKVYLEYMEDMMARKDEILTGIKNKDKNYKRSPFGPNSTEHLFSDMPDAITLLKQDIVTILGYLEGK